MGYDGWGSTRRPNPPRRGTEEERLATQAKNQRSDDRALRIDGKTLEALAASELTTITATLAVADVAGIVSYTWSNEFNCAGIAGSASLRPTTSGWYSVDCRWTFTGYTPAALADVILTSTGAGSSGGARNQVTIDGAGAGTTAAHTQGTVGAFSFGNLNIITSADLETDSSYTAVIVGHLVQAIS